MKLKLAIKREVSNSIKLEVITIRVYRTHSKRLNKRKEIEPR